MVEEREEQRGKGKEHHDILLYKDRFHTFKVVVLNVYATKALE